MLLRHHNFAFFLELATALYSSISYADKDVDLTANIVSSTCQVEVNNNGIVDLY